MPAPSDGRARVRAAVGALGFVLLGYVGTSLAARPLLAVLARVWPGLPASLIGLALSQAAIGLVVLGALTWLIGRRVLSLTGEELGWATPRVGLRGFGRGLAVGTVVAALALALGVPFGVAAWSRDGGGFGAYLARLVVLAAVLLPPAFVEEVAFRGVAFAGLRRAGGPGFAVLVTSMLFAAAHRLNPDVSGLALGNIALAGIFLGLTFLTPGGLWTATGAHWGWNLALAGLAAPVSGLPFEIPAIDFLPGEPPWLTGGGFGPEGGLFGTVALSLGIGVAARWGRAARRE
jgi:membrane protease YdiL (CAAX protease family)